MQHIMQELHNEYVLTQKYKVLQSKASSQFFFITVLPACCQYKRDHKVTHSVL